MELGNSLLRALFLLQIPSVLSNQDCFLSWTGWSVVFNDPVSNSAWQDRMRILHPGSENGSSCNYGEYINRIGIQYMAPLSGPYEDLNVWEQQVCSSSEWITCGNNRCIPISLRCNGDDDCGDASDEYPHINCSNHDPTYICGIKYEQSTSSTAPKAERYLMGIPGIERFSSGFDILTGNLKGETLSMNPFGSCRRVLKSGETDTYYRLPGNVNSFTQEFSISQTGGTIVTNASGLITSLQNQLLENPYVGGVIGGDVAMVGLNQEKHIQNYILESDRTQNKFVSVMTGTNVRVFKVSLKEASQLNLGTAFMKRLYELPANYSYSRYISLIQDFGTHYIASATLGGSYGQTSKYSRCWLEDGYEFDFENNDWKDNLVTCEKENFKQQMNPNFTPSGICLSKSGEKLVDQADGITIKIVGGSVSVASTLKTSLNTQNWITWINSVVSSPSLLPFDNFVLQPISSLVDVSSLQIDQNKKKQVKTNINQAIQDYLKPYNATLYCSDSNISEYCVSKCGSGDVVLIKNGTNADPAYNSLRYLTGTGGSQYKCICLCNSIPGFDVCSGIRTSSYLFFVVLMAIFSMTIGLN